MSGGPIVTARYAGPVLPGMLFASTDEPYSESVPCAWSLSFPEVEKKLRRWYVAVEGPIESWISASATVAVSANPSLRGQLCLFGAVR